MGQEESSGTILSCQIKDFQIGVLNFTILESFFCKNAPGQYKTELEKPGSKIKYGIQNISYKKHLLVLNKEKKVKNSILTQKKVKLSTRVLLCSWQKLFSKIVFPNRNKQISFYLLLNKLLYGKKKEYKVAIMSPTNQNSFTIEKNIIKKPAKPLNSKS